MPADRLFHPLTTMDDLDEALDRAQHEPVVVYKHSRICPLSARMQKTEVATLDRPDDPPVYRVVVQDARAVSDAVAERFGVRHESPQVLLVYEDAVLHDASHGRIAADDIRTHSAPAAHD